MVLNTDNDETRRAVEHCYRNNATLINPIIDWTTADVWEFLNAYGCESNPLYQEGFDRIGCIGCPMGGKYSQKKEFSRYPKYKAGYERAFNKMLDQHKNLTWNSGADVMSWWLGEDPNQITLEGYYGDLIGGNHGTD